MFLCAINLAFIALCLLIKRNATAFNPFPWYTLRKDLVACIPVLQRDKIECLEAKVFNPEINIPSYKMEVDSAQQHIRRQSLPLGGIANPQDPKMETEVDMRQVLQRYHTGQSDWPSPQNW